MEETGARLLLNDYRILLTPEQLLDLRKRIMEGCVDDFLHGLTRIVMDYTAPPY